MCPEGIVPFRTPFLNPAPRNGWNRAAFLKDKFVNPVSNFGRCATGWLSKNEVTCTRTERFTCWPRVSSARVLCSMRQLRATPPPPSLTPIRPVLPAQHCRSAELCASHGQPVRTFAPRLEPCRALHMPEARTALVSATACGVCSQHLFSAQLVPRSCLLQKSCC